MDHALRRGGEAQDRTARRQAHCASQSREFRWRRRKFATALLQTRGVNPERSVLSALSTSSVSVPDGIRTVGNLSGTTDFRSHCANERHSHPAGCVETGTGFINHCGARRELNPRPSDSKCLAELSSTVSKASQNVANGWLFLRKRVGRRFQASAIHRFLHSRMAAI